MEISLKNKVIVISGGTKGIGKRIAVEAAKCGADIVLGGRDRESAERVLAEIKTAGRKGVFVSTNLRDTDDCKTLFQTAVDTFKKVDGFVNYAGVSPIGTLTETDRKVYDNAFDINIRSAFFCTQQAVLHMRANGGGSIVMFGSPHAWCGEKNRAAYACSKGALLTLTEHVAHHYAVDNIRCNFVTMGWVPTEGELSLRAKEGMTSEELHAEAAKFIPMGRMQEVEDHVPGVLYLLSDESSMVTGSNLRVTGGMYIG